MKYHLKTLLQRPSDKELLSIWQEIIKVRAKYKCEYPNCRKTEYLNAHHIHSKSKKSTRYDTDNGICLCSGHHSLNNNSAHKDPDFKSILIENNIRTKEFFEKLRYRAFQPAKLDLNLIKLDLLNQLKKYV